MKQQLPSWNVYYKYLIGEYKLTDKAIIDYAQDDNAVEFRNALYTSIQDKVTAHIDAKKQEIAQNLITPQQAVQQETEQEQTGENA